MKKVNSKWELTQPIWEYNLGTCNDLRLTKL